MLRRLRRILLFSVAILAVLAGAAVALWLTVGRDWAVAWLVDELNEAGVPIRSFTIERVGLEGFVVRDVVIGDRALVVRRVSVDVTLEELVEDGDVDEVEISGVDLRLVLMPDGEVVLPGWVFSDAAEPATDEAPSALDMPFERVDVTDISVTVETPAGDVTGIIERASAVATPDGALRLATSGAIGHAVGGVTVEVDAALAADGTVEGELVLRDGAMTWSGFAAQGVSGWLSASGALGRLDTIEGMVELSRLTWPDGVAENIAVLAAGPGESAWISLRGHLPDGAGAAAVEATWADPAAALVHAQVALDVADLSALPIAALADVLPSGAGRLTAAVDIPLSAVLAVGDRLPSEVTGDAALQLDDITVDGVADGMSAEIAGDLVWRDNRLTVTGVEPWRIAGASEALGVDIAAVIDGPGDDPARLTVDLGSQAPTIGLLAAASVDTPVASVTGPIELMLTVDPDDGPRVEVAQATLAAAPIDRAGLTIHPHRVYVSGTLSPGSGTVSVSAEGTFSGGPAGVFTVEDGAVAVDADIRWHDEGTEIRATDCIRVSVGSAVVDGVASLPDGLSVCIEPAADGAGPSWQDDGGLWQAGGTIPEVRTRLIVDDGAGGTEVVGILPRLAIRAAGSAAGPSAATVELSGGDLVIPSVDVRVSDWLGSLTMTPDDEQMATLDIGRATVTMLGDNPPVVPLRVRGSADFDAAGGVTFNGVGVGAGGALVASAYGRHLPGRGGRVDLVVSPTSLTVDGTQLSDLSPALSIVADIAVEGTVSATGYYGWGASRGSRADIALDASTVVSDVAAADGVAARLVAQPLVPLTFPPGQRVTADAVNVGVLLGEAAIAFAVDPDTTMSVSEAGFAWADGRLDARPFVVRPDDPEQVITFDAAGLDLARLVEDLSLDGLAATGRLSGVLPIRLTDDTIFVDRALLSSTEPGVIRYTPDGDPAGFGDDSGGVDLLLNAVRNFHYESLSLSLSGRTGGDLIAGLSIRGANPDLYEGYPIALNINASGALDRILRRSLATVRIADNVEALIGEGGQQPDVDSLVDGLRSIVE